ncbi:MAG: lamin tail domain-containing protein [Akkermansiaceae bacterium]
MRTLLFLFTAFLVSISSAAPSGDLLGYWNLDSNTNDSAPGGTFNDNGSWVGTTTYNSATAPFGAAASLDGSSYILIPSSPDIAHAGGSLTVSVWCQINSWDKNWQALLSKGEGSNYRIARQGNDANAIAYAGGSGDIFGGAINDGQWHHLVAISEAGENTFLYVDGALVATGSAPSLADNGLDLLLGENPGSPGRQWNGGIDDVAIFDAPLSDQQAKAVYQFGTTYSYPMSEVVQIFDAHDSGGSVVIGDESWSYAASDTGSGTFVLLGADGSGVDVSSGPTITSFSSSPIFITSGGSATLSWQITPPFTAVSIDQGVSNVSAQTNGSGAGSISVSPTVSTSYTLSATNVDGATTRSTTLYVDVDPSTPRLNEFSADTAADGLLDEDGAVEDWIEIYNPGPNAADLSTFYLTDDSGSLNKWAFPSVVMPPNTYLVVFASSKDRAVAGNELHTNFKLSTGGEYLALSRDNGGGGFVIAGEFSPAYPAQEEGITYGIASDNITKGYFAAPTPNAPNGPAAQGFVADTTFDIDRGFFTAAFNLTITSATVDAQIRYTNDGSIPTSTSGTVYSGPINISSTTTIRAAAFKAGFFETNVDTHTYFFLDDVRKQFANGAAPTGWPSSNVNSQQFNYGMDPDITNRYTAQEMINALSAIPSVSISTAQANLTGSGSQGIYVNPGQHGKSWERAASVEIIHPNGTTQNVQSNCGLRIRGGFSRSTSNPKHALRLFFRDEYGDPKLKYPLFGAEGVDEFDKVDLRTSQNYSWAFQGDGSNTFLREVLGRDLQGSFGHPYTRSRYYHLYLNGVYWGLYMTQERAEANHAEAYLGGNKADYDTIKSAGSSGGYNTEATDGTFATGSDWHTLWTMARAQQTTPTIARFMELQGLNPDGSRNPALPIYLDVDNLIDYQMVIGYTGNYDGPLSDFVGASNNWYSVRDRVRDGFGVQFFVHDGEHSMGAGGKWNGANDRINTSNGSGSRGDYNKSNPSFIHFDLTENTGEYRLRFADRAHLALFNGGLLTQGSVMTHMNARKNTVADVIIAESARWGDSKRTDPFDEQDWNNAVNNLIGTINIRSNDFLGHLRTANLYPSLDAPAYSQHGGSVSTGSTIDTTVPTDGTHLYYLIGTGDSDTTDWQDGLDPRLVGGTVNPAASVMAISGGGSTATLTIPDTISGPVWIKSRTFDSTSGTWSAMNQAFFTTAGPANSSNIVISEVHYHPTDPTLAELAVDPTFNKDDFEFIEILNIGASTVDLGEAAFVLIPIGDHLEGVQFTFPLGTLIAPGERLVIAANSTAFAARYPGVAISGDYSGRLSNTGEWITLVDAGGAVIDSFRYNDLAPWPVAADGSGPSLIRVNPESDLDPALPASWSSSPAFGGSPGAADGTPFTGDPLADLDGDGFVAIIEYAQGLSDTVFSAGQHISVSSVDVGGIIYPSVSYREDPEAIDGDLSIEISSDMDPGNWSAGAPGLVFVETTNDPDGIPRHTYRLKTALDSVPHQFFRLKVVY